MAVTNMWCGTHSTSDMLVTSAVAKTSLDCPRHVRAAVSSPILLIWPPDLDPAANSLLPNCWPTLLAIRWDVNRNMLCLLAAFPR